MPRKRKTQTPRAAPNQTYGAAGQQLTAQHAIPLPDNTALAPPVPPSRPVPVPGAFGAFNRDTENPLEPVTAGAPLGPGPGPEVLPQQPSDDLVDFLAATYHKYESEEIRGMLEEAQVARGDFF